MFVQGPTHRSKLTLDWDFQDHCNEKVSLVQKSELSNDFNEVNLLDPATLERFLDRLELLVDHVRGKDLRDYILDDLEAILQSFDSETITEAKRTHTRTMLEVASQVIDITVQQKTFPVAFAEDEWVRSRLTWRCLVRIRLLLSFKVLAINSLLFFIYIVAMMGINPSIVATGYIGDSLGTSYLSLFTSYPDVNPNIVHYLIYFAPCYFHLIFAAVACVAQEVEYLHTVLLTSIVGLIWHILCPCLYYAKSNIFYASEHLPYIFDLVFLMVAATASIDIMVHVTEYKNGPNPASNSALNRRFSTVSLSSEPSSPVISYRSIRTNNQMRAAPIAVTDSGHRRPLPPLRSAMRPPAASRLNPALAPAPPSRATSVASIPAPVPASVPVPPPAGPASAPVPAVDGARPVPIDIKAIQSKSMVTLGGLGSRLPKNDSDSEEEAPFTLPPARPYSSVSSLGAAPNAAGGPPASPPGNGLSGLDKSLMAARQASLMRLASQRKAPGSQPNLAVVPGS